MTGAIALAAYEPDPTLFARQLKSIQDQTLSDFVCVISADGGDDDVRDLVKAAVGDDSRFVVKGYEERLGFYKNFERALRDCPDDADWYAFSDQDDYWHREKLERMVPCLTTSTVVSCQARVVQHPSGAVLKETTDRRNVGFAQNLVTNQFSGALMIFRPEVRVLSLPFPKMNTPSQVHDQWVASCGYMLGSTLVIDDVLQDYVQHGGNVIGEQEAQSNGWSVLQTVRNIRRLALRYEGNTHLKSLNHLIYNVGVGWKVLTLAELKKRIQPAPEQLKGACSVFVESGVRKYAIWILREWRAGTIAGRSAMETLGSRAISSPRRQLREMSSIRHTSLP